MSAPRPFSATDALRSLRRAPRRLLVAGCPSDPGAEADSQGRRFSSDAHYQREVHLILSGRRLFRVGGTVFRAGPGHAVLVDRWQEHGTWNPPDPGDRLVVAVLHGHAPIWWETTQGVGDGAFTAVPGSAVYLPEDVSTLFERRLDAAFACGDLAEATAWIRPVLAALVGEYRLGLSNRPRVSGPEPGAPTGLAQRIRARVLMEHGGVRGALARLASDEGVSSATLSRAYRAAFGRSFREDCERIRRDFVRNAVINGHRQKEVAEALGFTAASNYNRWLHGFAIEIKDR